MLIVVANLDTNANYTQLKYNNKEFSSGVIIKLSALKIDVTTCRNRQRITSRYRTKNGYCQFPRSQSHNFK